jgi:hypothetical protein
MSYCKVWQEHNGVSCLFHHMLRNVINYKGQHGKNDGYTALLGIFHFDSVKIYNESVVGTENT